MIYFKAWCAGIFDICFQEANVCAMDASITDKICNGTFYNDKKKLIMVG